MNNGGVYAKGFYLLLIPIALCYPLKMQSTESLRHSKICFLFPYTLWSWFFSLTNDSTCILIYTILFPFVLKHCTTPSYRDQKMFLFQKIRSDSMDYD